MSQADPWEDRYLAVVPEKLLWRDAEVLIEIALEDPERFVSALLRFDDVSRRDSWADRYLSVVPEKLSAADARVLIELMREDPERFIAALRDFVRNSQDEEVER
jgi:hypothetical protein